MPLYAGAGSFGKLRISLFDEFKINSNMPEAYKYARAV
jgi:hypothetical protein